MDLPRLGEDLPSAGRDPYAAIDRTDADTAALYIEDTDDSNLPLQEAAIQARRRQPAPEPLPAWLRGDEQLLDEDDFDDLDADDQATPPLGLRGLRWIRKNMSSLKVTVSLQRPTPPPGKPRRSA